MSSRIPSDQVVAELASGPALLLLVGGAIPHPVSGGVIGVVPSPTRQPFSTTSAYAVGNEFRRRGNDGLQHFQMLNEPFVAFGCELDPGVPSWAALGLEV